MSNDNDRISLSGSINSLEGEGEGTADAASNVSLSQTYAKLFYAGAGHSLKVLAILCQGLTNQNGHLLIDPSALPWSTAKWPTEIKLTANDLQKDVERRTVASGNIISGPCPKAWTIAHATQWLDDNPITDVAEVALIH